MRAFVFGAVITSIAITISSLAVDPRDLKMLGELLVGAVFFGGGCSAMFALPPESFRRLWSLGFQVFGFLPLLLPLKVLIGIALFPGVFIAFAFLVTTVSALSALRVLYVVIGTSIRRLVGACTHIEVRCTED